MIKDLEILYGRFPRQFAMPQRMQVNSMKELIDHIDLYNGKCRCFATLYNYTGVSNNIILDKCCFDFDDLTMVDENPRCWHDAMKLHDDLMSKNVMHTMIFSGKGFHFYIFSEIYSNGNNKEVLEAAQLDFINRLELVADPTSVGDVARFYGIPGSLNIKHGRFVCFIDEVELRMGYEFLKERAKKQYSRLKMYGVVKLDLTQFKVSNEKIDMSSMQIKDFNVQIDDKLLSNAPPCIIHALIGKDGVNPTWKQRWVFVVWAKENGWSPSMINDMALKYYSTHSRSDHIKNNYQHFKKVKVISYVFGRDEFFPSCERMMQMGLCPSKCSQYPYSEKLYKK